MNLETLRELYNDAAPALRMFAARWVGRAATDDIVQNAFVQLWEHRSSMPEGGSARAFLYTAVRFGCLNHLRRRRLQQRFEAEWEPEVDDIDANDILESETFAALLKAFEQLPVACRRVYALSLEGVSHAEIAMRMGITVNTVKKHKNNAHHFLRSKLKNLLSLLFFITPF